jgi:hypothetical protein
MPNADYVADAQARLATLYSRTRDHPDHCDCDLCDEVDAIMSALYGEDE